MLTLGVLVYLAVVAIYALIKFIIWVNEDEKIHKDYN